MFVFSLFMLLSLLFLLLAFVLLMAGYLESNSHTIETSKKCFVAFVIIFVFSIAISDGVIEELPVTPNAEQSISCQCPTCPQGTTP